VESLAATARAAYGRVLEVADISSITKMRADRGLARLAQLQTNRLEDLERREETADDYLVMATSNLPTRPGERSSGSVARTSSGGYRNITSASQFHNLVQRSGLPVLVEIGASWCPPCRAMEPHIRSLAAERSSSLLVLAVDGDDVPTVAQRFGVQAYPTLIMMRGGREVGRIVGGMDKQNLALFVDRY
jgi:thiol-disulfide isomerase/thioredoxin